jgi:small subunit ribosomal protein S20
MWAMIEKLRMRDGSMPEVDATKRPGLLLGRALGRSRPAATLSRPCLWLWPTARISFVANIKSQKKRIKTNAKRTERNKAVKSELKTRVKTATTAADEGSEDAGTALWAAQKRLDKAAARGVIHKNQAARRKSRLMKRVSAGA